MEGNFDNGKKLLQVPKTESKRLRRQMSIDVDALNSLDYNEKWSEQSYSQESSGGYFSDSSSSSDDDRSVVSAIQMSTIEKKRQRLRSSDSKISLCLEYPHQHPLYVPQSSVSAPASPRMKKPTKVDVTKTFHSGKKASLPVKGVKMPVVKVSSEEGVEQILFQSKTSSRKLSSLEIRQQTESKGKVITISPNKTCRVTYL